MEQVRERYVLFAYFLTSSELFYDGETRIIKRIDTTCPNDDPKVIDVGIWILDQRRSRDRASLSLESSLSGSTLLTLRAVKFE